ncbi:hypothetical protein HELRODRAFT_95414 [Helobdella robusta]|uniref:Poly [ADP-ribose] polymerase n=1 Tax=Helobdella robusta TaxID=6412 RepID=T1G956_HELRO|nr:hypothetical protein HELRODRAFT_95414 [Helobdella robusta]ESN96355.1 hypothetical protein HELRODRAFT_95414 [Helobdella robusta]
MAACKDLPYQVEYAKSGRSICKLCRHLIDCGSLRLAIMLQSPHFDGKMPNWHHYECFWNRVRCLKTDDIHGFKKIRWDDQEKIKKSIEAVKGGKKSAKGSSSSGGKAEDIFYGDYKVEYAKSSRSTCRSCHCYIDKDELRVSKKDYTSEKALMYGPQDEWHHLKCFNEHRLQLQFPESMDPKMLSGFKSLSADDQKLVLETLGKPKTQKRKLDGEKGDAGQPGVKHKKEDDDDDDDDEELMREQSSLEWQMRDKLQECVPSSDVKALLKFNKIKIPSGASKILDCIADAMVFGTLAPCPECQGQLRLSGAVSGYRCTGDISEWTKCQYITDDPERKEFLIPKKYLENNPFLAEYKFEARKKYFPKSSNISIENLQASQSSTTDSQIIKKEVGVEPAAASSSASQPSASTSSQLAFKPLDGLRVSSGGKLALKKEEIKQLVEKMGGKFFEPVYRNVHFAISNIENISKTNRHQTIWQVQRVPVVDIHFLTDLESNVDEDFQTIFKKHTISNWPCDQVKIIEAKPNVRPSTVFLKKEVSLREEIPMMAKMVVKGGAAVDPLSGLEYQAHVLQGESKKDLYTSVLGLVDVAKGTNSFYKLQLLEADSGYDWWLFRSWGRVGTAIGGTKLEKFYDVEEAIEAFEKFYREKTGNVWSKKSSFKKMPYKYFPLDIDYGNEANDEGNDKITQLMSASTSSKLAPEVQDLVRLIFDVENMKKTMLEFEIDLRKMPLGKLSMKQIESAYSVLTDAQQLISTGGSQSYILDASNRFYTLIPHDFGLAKPPLLDNEDIIKTKVAMLDNLLEIEVAYNLLISGSKAGVTGDVDDNYNKLKTDIAVLDKSSEEFQRICQFVKNTHAATHDEYDLQVSEVFTISRLGESKVYESFKSLHNRMLLWHGSRLTNYAGILSKGLRIAPKEAPSTGYMFGKGIYFADMASKSANYCFTSRKDPTGLMLLSEVALGNMHELTQANFITELPRGKHSVKGLGTTAPDPKQNYVCEDGVVIPMGKGVKTKVKLTSLLYNEYIVYDVAQVNMKYLLKLNFKYKRSRY